jgi:hypothetical protein
MHKWVIFLLHDIAREALDFGTQKLDPHYVWGTVFRVRLTAENLRCKIDILYSVDFVLMHLQIIYFGC